MLIALEVELSAEFDRACLIDLLQCNAAEVGVSRVGVRSAEAWMVQSIEGV